VLGGGHRLGIKNLYGTYSGRAKMGLRTNTSPLSIPLLRTCKQIYAETALIPYTLNILVFQDIADIRQFVVRPTQMQIQAIKVLEIQTVFGMCFSNGDIIVPSKWYSAFEPVGCLQKIQVEDTSATGRYEPVREASFRKLAGRLRDAVPGVAVSIWDSELGPASACDF
jgi:hypothetical protein